MVSFLLKVVQCADDPVAETSHHTPLLVGQTQNQESTEREAVLCSCLALSPKYTLSLQLVCQKRQCHVLGK